MFNLVKTLFRAKNRFFSVTDEVLFFSLIVNAASILNSGYIGFSQEDIDWVEADNAIWEKIAPKLHLPALSEQTQNNVLQYIQNEWEARYRNAIDQFETNANYSLSSYSTMPLDQVRVMFQGRFPYYILNRKVDVANALVRTYGLDQFRANIIREILFNQIRTFTHPEFQKFTERQIARIQKNSEGTYVLIPGDNQIPEFDIQEALIALNPTPANTLQQAINTSLEKQRNLGSQEVEEQIDQQLPSRGKTAAKFGAIVAIIGEGAQLSSFVDGGYRKIMDFVATVFGNWTLQNYNFLRWNLNDYGFGIILAAIIQTLVTYYVPKIFQWKVTSTRKNWLRFAGGVLTIVGLFVTEYIGAPDGSLAMDPQDIAAFIGGALTFSIAEWLYLLLKNAKWSR